LNFFRRRQLLATALILTTGLALAGCPSTSDNATSKETTDGSSGAAAGAKKGNPNPAKLVFGFVPSAEANKIADSAKPMADFIASELGIPVETFTSTDYVGMIEAMDSKKVDIGSLPPLAYVLAKDKNAAEVIIKTSRHGSLTYHAMFTARADSGITSLEQAKGKRMAFTDANSTSGYLFPVAYMKKKGMDPETYFAQTIFAGSHDNAIRSVYDKSVDIAATYDDARNKLEKDPTTKDVKNKVVIIGKTDEIPNDTISVRTGLDPALVAKINAALIKYAHTPEGKKTLMDVYEVDDLVEAKDSDYDNVREVAKAMDFQLSSLAKKK
jgi:phosphonate transport system substrate-binding protein